MGLNSAAVQLGSTRRVKPLPANAPFYRRLWHGWQRVARVLGNVLSRIVTSLGFLLLLPFSLGIRIFADPLQLKPTKPQWTPLPPAPTTVDEARVGF